MTDLPNSLRTQPDARGHFGQFGGRYVAETLMPLILDLEREYRVAKADPAFQADFARAKEEFDAARAAATETAAACPASLMRQPW